MDMDERRLDRFEEMLAILTTQISRVAYAIETRTFVVETRAFPDASRYATCAACDCQLVKKGVMLCPVCRSKMPTGKEGERDVDRGKAERP